MNINHIYVGDSNDLIQQLINRQISLVITSPPYANQRKSYYESVSEAEYPKWFCGIMEALWPKVTDDGSVFVVIRPHIQNGRVSDYVLKTRLMLRDIGWIECEELIWHKPDAPPLGSYKRPRRTWESVLWYAKTAEPYTDLKACGTESKRIGFAGSKRFGLGKGTILASKQQEPEDGISRISDVIRAPVNLISKGVMHPAMYPQLLPDTLIRTFSRKGDTVLDPFCGSGTTLISARQNERYFIGFDIMQEYVTLATQRLEEQKTIFD